MTLKGWRVVKPQHNQSMAKFDVWVHLLEQVCHIKSRSCDIYGSVLPITKTCLYNFDPLKPHFWLVKLGFTGVYIIFLISAKKYWLWVLVRTISRTHLDAPSDWRPGGRGFNPRRGRQHSFVEIDHEIFSTVILSLPLIQEGQLSVSGERMCTVLVNRLED